MMLLWNVLYGKGTVSELSLKDLKSLDAGSYFSKSFEYEMIPTLEEVLNLLNEKNMQEF